MYYVATTVLKWDDDAFWDASPRFLFKQLDIHNKIHKDSNKSNPNEKPKKDEYGRKITKGEKKTLRVL